MKIVAEASAPRRGRRARGHADRPERQRLSRRRTGRAAVDARAPARAHRRRARRSRGCATPPAIPATWTTSLIAAHRDLPGLMPYLHLPVQSGSDRILAAMNRRHTRADYLDAIARVRAAQPDMAFSSDFIVGFPGEREDDFQATLSLVGRGRLRRRLLLQVFAPAGHAGRRDAGPTARGGQIRAALPLAGGNRPSPGRVSTRNASGAPSTCCSKSRDAILARSSAAPHISSQSQVMAPATNDRGNRRGDDHRDPRQQPVRRARHSACGTYARGANAGGGLKPLRSSRSDNGPFVSPPTRVGDNDPGTH